MKSWLYVLLVVIAGLNCVNAIVGNPISIFERFEVVFLSSVIAIINAIEKKQG